MTKEAEALRQTFDEEPELYDRTRLPRGPGWAYEVMWDGIRGQVALGDGTVTVRSRPGRDCSESFPELSEPPPAFDRRSAVLDGEIVCLDPGGYPDFAAVRARLAGAGAAEATPLAFMAFDVLSLAGEPTAGLPSTASGASCSRHSASRARPGARQGRSKRPGSCSRRRVSRGSRGMVAKRLDSPCTRRAQRRVGKALM